MPTHKGDADPAVYAIAQLTRQRLDFPAVEPSQVQKALVNRIRLDCRNHRAQRVSHTSRQVAIYVECKRKENRRTCSVLLNSQSSGPW